MAAEENGKKDKLNNAKKTRVIPGYHLTLGIVIAMLSLIVLIPLASVLVSSLKLSPGEFWHLLLKKNVLNAFKTSIGCSFIAAVVNTVFGLIIAWTLVKYDFPGKKILDGFIELPFCLPTAVAGITLSRLYSEDGFLGKPLAALGIDVAYTKIGLTIALVFVGIPFVIRAVQPILEKMDNQYEEAAYMLCHREGHFSRLFFRSSDRRCLQDLGWHLPEESESTAVSSTYQATAQRSRRRSYHT